VIVAKECLMASGDMLQNIELFETFPTFCDQANEYIAPICGFSNAVNRPLSMMSAET
jgi:hypothetical protein